MVVLPKSVVLVDCDCKSASSSTTDGSQCARVGANVLVDVHVCDVHAMFDSFFGE